MNNHSFMPRFVRTSNELGSVLREAIDERATSYYFFTNQWDKISSFFSKKLAELARAGGQYPLNVVDIFDVPNAMNILKGTLIEEGCGELAAQIRPFSKIPSLVVIYPTMVRTVDYNGSISTELGL